MKLLKYENSQVTNVELDPLEKSALISDSNGNYIDVPDGTGDIPIGYYKKDGTPTTSWVENGPIYNLDSDLILQKMRGLVSQISPGNLLGNYGNFENDSNSDGLADGWTSLGRTTHEHVTDAVFGNYAQKIITTSVAGVEKYIGVSTIADDDDKLYISFYGKIAASNTITTLKLVSSYAATGRLNLNLTASTTYQKFVTVWSAKSFSYLYLGLPTELSGEIAYFDGLQIINLTKLGALPTWAQAYYGVENWEDMSAADLSEILDYHDGYDTESSLEIENKGADIENPRPDKITVSPDLFGNSGVYDELDIQTGRATRYWSEWKEYTTDGSGNITITDYKLNSIAHIMRISDSQIKEITSASTTLATGWNSTAIKVRYQLSTAITEQINPYQVPNIYNGQNNLIMPSNTLFKIEGIEDQKEIDFTQEEPFYLDIEEKVTFENLNTNGDVGTGSDQVAVGNHTHTASTITDFDTEVANNSAVTANTAKVTNATHTGDVTGSTALTIANDAVTNTKLANMGANTIKGAVSAGDPQDLTPTQVRTMINVADGANNYVLPQAGDSLGGVQTGGDVTISAGTITVNDDSHNHVISNVDGLQTALDGKAAASSGVPTGTIVDFAGSTAPSGWLLCYGQAISRTTYAALFSVINTIYGVGDGNTTFNLPDCRGRVNLGKDDMGGTSANRVTASQADNLGQGSGAETHTLTEAQMPSHSHSINGYTSGTSVVQIIGAATTGTPSVYTSTGSAGSGSAHNNMPPYITLNKIIKT